MVKRKHFEYLSDASDTENIADRLLSRQKKLCAQKLEKGKKELVQGLKLAAAFERQKQGRRKKTAGDKDSVLGRLEKEYGFLKSLDTNKTATSHIRKTLSRVKSIKDHHALPDWAREGEKEGYSQEELNVLARLYKAPAVKKVMDEIVEGVRGVLGAPVPSVQKDARSKERMEKADGDGDKGVKGVRLKEGKVHKEGKRAPMDDFSGSDSDDEFAGFDGRIAGPSDEESSDDEDEGAVLRRPRIASFSGLSDLSDSEEEDIPKSKLKKATLAEKPSSSTFLPSLTMANYMSGSDSEASDLSDVAPKKNRRGQRARQALWEKKYGEKAKHLTEGKKEGKGDERNKGWDAKRGATEGAGGRGNRRERRARERKSDEAADTNRDGGETISRGRWGRPKPGERETGANAIPMGKKPTKRDDTGPLHPSWAAAKAAKEKKMGIKPAGTKVVFD
ncbi:Bud-site selection protein [Delitschia confertaspora ATCC 74209]|uniref:Bud-site selection protein n=1 Tax=Delitschia confertaspora ATCC 74209 TaxID=1513339 RepID=A0A9P4JU44_9PLEO|nr:Bud-site selection protein [Delitschia confertaspora ATCC 74209]